jgi:hypothetical protein
MTRAPMVILAVLAVACNPFAPGLDNSPSGSGSVLGDQHTVEGVFQNMKYAYAFRDTTIYGQLFDAQYLFLYRDYERGVNVTWGRDEELRTTSGLFQNVQRLDLVWNNIIALSTDSANTLATVSRNFNLTVTFSPEDILRVDGYASLSMTRVNPGDPWRIVQWRDESNF